MKWIGKDEKEDTKEEGKLYLKDRRTEERRREQQYIQKQRKRGPDIDKIPQRGRKKAQGTKAYPQELVQKGPLYERDFLEDEGFISGEDEGQEMYVAQKNRAMFWLRCIVAMMLFGLLVLSDCNHWSYKGFSVADVKKEISDTVFLEKAGDLAQEVYQEFMR